VIAAFERLSARRPEAALVVSPRRVARVADVDALARAAGHALEATDVEPGRLVVMSAPNGPAFLASLVAVRRRDAIAVLADAAAPEAELERIAARLGAAAVLVCRDAWPAGPANWAARRVAARPAVYEGAGFAKLTSGSSGEPSAILATSEALAADDDALFRSMGLRDDDRFVAAIPFSHSYGLSSLAMPALRRGSMLALPEEGGPWGPLDAARAAGATVFPTVPLYVRTIGDLAETPPLPATLRLVLSAGATLPAQIAARFREAFGLPVHVFYGASEVGGICYDREGGAAERGTVGTPVDGVRLDLRGGDGSEGLANGLANGLAEGVVVVRSPAVALRHVPEAQASLGGGTFVSGDQATWTPSGELRLLGRLDAWINVGGKKVNPREVEAVLASLPGVREAVVLGVLRSGGSTETVRAVVACDTRRMSYTEVAAWCRERLAGHKVPRSIVLVEEIPRTDRGKVDRAALLAAIIPATRR